MAVLISYDALSSLINGEKTAEPQPNVKLQWSRALATNRRKTMRKNMFDSFAITFSLVLVAVMSLNAAAASVSRITKEELKPILENSEVLVVDVRLGKDWEGSEHKIKGAVHVNPREVVSWASQYSKDATLVFYCA
jgi:hypothetical protein